MQAFARACLLFCGVLLVGDKTSAETPRVDYNRDIRPILADKCFLCHGPDQRSRQGGLTLHTPEGAVAALESDASKRAIVPGNVVDSVLIQRILTRDPAEMMPPAESNLRLTDAERSLLSRWIEQGAEYQQHWAFLPPKKSPPPTTSGPDWGRNEIDAFVLHRMRQQGLEPNRPAAPEQLLRRVSFDLTGLPPTLAELDEFLADPSDAAYEKAVDRLLASPRFGERLAAEWLDVARYSDTYGFQVDRDRFVWPWRDWVIRAFNQDLGYDQFVIRQLAGDLLPNAGQNEILATTFCRLHPQEAEGGSVPEEYRVSYVADRIQTVATAMLGLTLECARCHDHKYDPISQKEYFQLFAFFDDIDEAGLYSFFTPAIPTPTLLLTSDETQRKLDAQRAEILRLEGKLASLAAAQSDETRVVSRPDRLTGEILHLPLEKVAAPNSNVPGVNGMAVLLTGDDSINTEVGNFHRYDPFSYSLWINTPDVKSRAVILHRSRAWTDAGSRGYELLLDEGKLSAALIHFDPGNSLRVTTRAPIPTGTWVHVAVTYDGSSQANGLRLSLNGKPAEVDAIRDQLTKDITGGGGDHIALGERFRDSGFKGGMIDEVRVFDRELTPLEVSWLHQEFASDKVEGVPQVTEKLQTEYLRVVESPEWRRLLAELREARRVESEIVESIPEIMVMREMPQPRKAALLNRGEYNLRGEEVFAGTPAVFPPMPDNAPLNRLGFAKWLMSADHPLAARVAVNRYWQLIFGAGLVRTTEDMGNQGEWPSHPELLDTLARSWVEQGWSVKWLLKQMVLSETYRQSAVTSPEKEASDPTNRWLARTASDRLPAEMLRDNALAISGLLVETIGGPPAKPYEMEVAFKPLKRDTGDGLYRRSLYTFWSRTGPAPVMMTLDAAKRDVCQVRRDRTISPLQPLVMLNGPQFVEAARVLAERVMKSHPGDVDATLIDLFRWTTSRRPSEEELYVLKKLYTRQRTSFEADHASAERLLSVGDRPVDASLDPPSLAAFTGVASMLLNFDECVFRR